MLVALPAGRPTTRKGEGMASGDSLFRGVGEAGAAILRDILSLSSGTMAAVSRNIGWPAWLRQNGAAIDGLQFDFATFAAGEIRDGRRFASWQIAWRAYVEHWREGAENSAGPTGLKTIAADMANSHRRRLVAAAVDVLA